jgi:PAP2 superfamily
MGTLLSAALITSHDGTVGSEEIDPKLRDRRIKALVERSEYWAKKDPEEAKKARFRTLAPGFRDRILDGELLQTVRVEPADKSATIFGVSGDTSKVPIIEIIRPKIGVFGAQVENVLGYADLREERAAEILAQIGSLPVFFAGIDFLDDNRTPWTLMLLEATIRFVSTLTQRVKFALDCPRPLLFSDRIQPMILTPTHGAFPSGHATEAHAIATVLTRLTGGDPVKHAIARSRRFRLATRIAINRTVAGLHYPIDSACGAVLGIALGEYLAKVARADGPYADSWVFNGEVYKESDFNEETLKKIAGKKIGGVTFAENSGKQAASESVFELVWKLASRELPEDPS